VKIRIGLAWMKGTQLAKAFKAKGGQELMADYLKRLKAFAPCDVTAFPKEKSAGTCVWLCDRERASKQISSEQLAVRIQDMLNSGTREWHILIGGPDGFSTEQITALRPDFIWGFGPMTLPHELAAVVAAEQVYRAFTILHKHPYHSGH